MTFRIATCPMCQSKMYGEEALTADDRAGECISCYHGVDDADTWLKGFQDGQRAAATESVGLSGSSLVPFTEITARPIVWAWRERMALGKITALAGRPKIGKGLLYSYVISQVTRGTLDGDLDGPRNTIIVTTEDEPGDTLKPRLMAAGADVSRVFQFHMGSRHEPVPFRVPHDADQLLKRVRESEAAVIVVDPLIEFIDGKVDSHKSHPVRQAVASLNVIARETGCAILVIFHLNKGTSTDPLLRHEGSAAFTQVVRGGMLLGQDPEQPKGDRRVLAVTSTNLTKLAPSLVYEIAEQWVEGDEGGPIRTARMRCVGESDADGHDLLKPPGHDDGESSALDEAKDFLRDELASGPQLAKEVQAAARSLGITPITLKRARQDLSIKAAKDGFQGPWKWSLQRGSSADEPLWKSSDDHLCESPVFTGDSGDARSKGAHHTKDEHLWLVPPENGSDDGRQQ